MRQGAVVTMLVAAIVSSGPAAAASTSDIVVSSRADLINGDTSTVARLIAAPGPDGISLREAIEATNRDPGAYTIRFAALLKGSTIALHSELPPLTAGGLTIEGDIDGDGKPDVTLAKAADFRRTYCPNDADGCGIEIASSGNKLHALAISGLGTGVAIEDWQPSNNAAPLTHRAISNNTVSALTVSGANAGVSIGSDYNGTCGLASGHSDPCWTYNTWANTTVTANVIEARQQGVALQISNAGDRVDGLTVTDNTVRMNGTDAGIVLLSGGNATGVTIANGLIARNVITGRSGGGIEVGAGAQRARSNTTADVQVVDNRVDLVSNDGGYCCQGVVLLAGSDADWAIRPDVLPLGYPDGNELRNVVVARNTVAGTLVWGITLQSGLGAGGSANSVHDIQIQANTVSSRTAATGVLIWTAGGSPFGGHLQVANRIAQVEVAANRVSIGTATGTRPVADAGILVMGGGAFGKDGSVRDVQIVNDLVVGGTAGIVLAGGDEGATGNVLANVRVVNDTISGQASSALRIVNNENEGKGTSGNTVSGTTATNTIFDGAFAGEVTPSMIRSSVLRDAAFASVNGNVTGDPRFADAAAGDFHLQAMSPAIGAGTDEGAPSTDLEGRTRISGHIDVGAYAFTQARQAPPPAPLVSCTPTVATGSVEQRIAQFWQRVNALGPSDLLTAADLGQWAINLVDRDPAAAITVADFRASTAAMQLALDRAATGTQGGPRCAGTEQRVAQFWQRVDALSPRDLLTATDITQWALNVTDRDASARMRVDDFRATTASMQAALDRAALQVR